MPLQEPASDGSGGRSSIRPSPVDFLPIAANATEPMSIPHQSFVVETLRTSARTALLIHVRALRAAVRSLEMSSQMSYPVIATLSVPRT